MPADPVLQNTTSSCSRLGMARPLSGDLTSNASAGINAHGPQALQRGRVCPGGEGPEGRRGGEPRCGLNVSCWRVDVHGAIGKGALQREAAVLTTRRALGE